MTELTVSLIYTAPTHEEAKAWLKAHPGETLSGFAAHYPGGFAEAIKLGLGFLSFLLGYVVEGQGPAR